MVRKLTKKERGERMGDLGYRLDGIDDILNDMIAEGLEQSREVDRAYDELEDCKLWQLSRKKKACKWIEKLEGARKQTKEKIDRMIIEIDVIKRDLKRYGK